MKNTIEKIYNKFNELDDLYVSVTACKKCDLCESSRPILGEGYPSSRYMFVGGSPNEADSLNSRVFMGARGVLLNNIIKGMKLNRADVYITNILKGSPKRDRKPSELEIKGCRKYLFAEIQIVNPVVIVCFGSTAAQVITEEEKTIREMRGLVYEYKGIKVVPTYHPDFILKQPSKKGDVWNDIKIAMDIVSEDEKDRQGAE